MDSLAHDFRYAMRGLRNQPGFAALAILTLALGIGATTTIFSVIYGVLLDPFPYKDAHRVVLVQVHDNDRPGRGGRGQFQTAEFLDYQAANNVFEDVIAGGFSNVMMTTPEGTEQLQGGLVSPNQFTFLGVPALIGRTLTPDDSKPDQPPVCLLSYKFWLRRYNEDPGVLNRTLMLNNIPTTVVGVMPPRFTKLAADVYLPTVLQRGDERMARMFWRFQGRLKPGVSMEKAAAELDILGHRLAGVYPNLYPKNFTVRVISWVDNLVGPFRKTLYILGAAVGMLLLIACANVANMLLARATTREKEMAVRAALGATRWQLIRQLLAESALLAVSGAVLGCGFTFAGIKAVRLMMPPNSIPDEAVIEMNGWVLIFSLGLAMLTSIIFGLVPALQASRLNLVESLKDSAKGSSGGSGGIVRSVIVVKAIGLSLMLLVGAGLMMRSFVKMQDVDLGFDPSNILAAQIPLGREHYRTPHDRRQFFQRLLTRLQTNPEIKSVSVANSLPPYFSSGSEIDIPGKTHTERWETLLEETDENYLRTLGLKLQRGRWLSDVDVSDARKVCVVNQSFAVRYFGQEDPIGRTVQVKRFAPRGDVKEDNSMVEIIGVIGDIKNQGLQEPPGPEVYVPFTIDPNFSGGIFVRTHGDPLGLVEVLRREIWAVDRNIALTFTETITNFISRNSYAQPRFSLMVLGVFAGVGLVLVTIGVYSVMAYSVSKQTQEIGIRMALGASRADILRLILRTGAILIAAGILLGLALSWAATRVLESQLQNVSTRDPWTFAAIAAIIAIVGLAACYFPARRATRVDPLVALRHE